nr:MAG TPA: hypothetical protein [Caudoviricetes sp.]
MTGSVTVTCITCRHTSIYIAFRRLLPVTLA